MSSRNTAMKKKLPRKAGKAAVAMYKHDSGATAVQVDAPDGSQVVVCENLRVLVTKQDGVWIAQGLEIDYAAEGDTIPQVKQRFEQGLAMTIESHLRVHNNIRKLLSAQAPPELWAEYFDKKNTLRRFVHSQAMMMQLQRHLPFDRIVWLEDKDSAA
jgi:hypothetical protein